jgi:hypothetical protein
MGAEQDDRLTSPRIQDSSDNDQNPNSRPFVKKAILGVVAVVLLFLVSLVLVLSTDALDSSKATQLTPSDGNVKAAALPKSFHSTVTVQPVTTILSRRNLVAGGCVLAGFAVVAVVVVAIWLAKSPAPAQKNDPPPSEKTTVEGQSTTLSIVQIAGFGFLAIVVLLVVFCCCIMVAGIFKGSSIPKTKYTLSKNEQSEEVFASTLKLLQDAPANTKYVVCRHQVKGFNEVCEVASVETIEEVNNGGLKLLQCCKRNGILYFNVSLPNEEGRQCNTVDDCFGNDFANAPPCDVEMFSLKVNRIKVFKKLMSGKVPDVQCDLLSQKAATKRKSTGADHEEVNLSFPKNLEPGKRLLLNKVLQEYANERGSSVYKLFVLECTGDQMNMVQLPLLNAMVSGELVDRNVLNRCRAALSALDRYLNNL